MAREAQAAPAHDHTGPDHTTKSLGSLGKEGEGDGGGAAHRLDGGLLLALGGEVRGVDVAWWRGGWGWVRPHRELRVLPEAKLTALCPTLLTSLDVTYELVMDRYVC